MYMCVYRLAEEGIVKEILASDSSIARAGAHALVRQWFVAAPMIKALSNLAEEGITLDVTRTADCPLWADDAAFLAWAKSEAVTSQLAVRFLYLGITTCGNLSD